MTQRKGMGLNSFKKQDKRKVKVSAVSLLQAKACPRILQDVAELQCLWGRQGWVMSNHSEGVLPLSDRSKWGLKK